MTELERDLLEIYFPLQPGMYMTPKRLTAAEKDALRERFRREFEGYPGRSVVMDFSTFA